MIWVPRVAREEERARNGLSKEEEDEEDEEEEEDGDSGKSTDSGKSLDSGYLSYNREKTPEGEDEVKIKPRWLKVGSADILF